VSPSQATESSVTVRADGRDLRLANLDKVLYPETGTTKAEVVDYYARIAPVLLPHLAGRPLTVRRFPDGVRRPGFFEKNAPNGTPGWVRQVRLPSPGSGKDREEISYVVVEGLPTLVWLANLAALELHVPMWRVDAAGRPQHPDRLVVDLDPGAPADLVDCCRVALAVRGALRADGLAPLPKTSGGKGLQLYAALDGSAPWASVHGYARRLAERLAREQPESVVSSMAKAVRPGRVLLDWSQNNAAKTTVAPYSLRAQPQPTASTPVTWAEVQRCADSGDPAPLRLLAGDTLRRVSRRGDAFAELFDRSGAVPP
jgi:bifunctional non-homologous end joining protein LigD